MREDLMWDARQQIIVPCPSETLPGQVAIQLDGKCASDWRQYRRTNLAQLYTRSEHALSLMFMLHA
jgi:hypothetical protein